MKKLTLKFLSFAVFTGLLCAAPLADLSAATRNLETDTRDTYTAPADNVNDRETVFYGRTPADRLGTVIYVGTSAERANSGETIIRVVVPIENQGYGFYTDTQSNDRNVDAQGYIRNADNQGYGCNAGTQGYGCNVESVRTNSIE